MASKRSGWLQAAGMLRKGLGSKFGRSSVYPRIRNCLYHLAWRGKSKGRALKTQANDLQLAFLIVPCS